MKVQKPTILSIDDEPSNQRLMEVALLNQYHMLFAKNGHEALEILDKQDPDLVLMDINMPGQNGFSLCEQVRTQFNHVILPILFISAEDTVSMRINAYESGGNDFLCKPVIIAELLKKIEVLLKNRLKYQDIRGSLVQSRAAILSVAGLNAEHTSITRFIDISFDCININELADAFFILSSTFGLQASIQFSQLNGTKTFSSISSALAIEEELLVNPGEAELKKEGKELFSGNNVAILISDFPTEDESFTNRIRNYIKLALKACEARLKILDIKHSLQ